jgi:DNA (cytosine-5)-methyltransferase 1
MDMTQIELFAGIGGFGLAGHWAGIETVCQVEIDPFCQKVLAKNFPNAIRFGDIKNFTYAIFKSILRNRGIRDRRVDIVSGGFPCQPVSTAGKRLGTTDDRWHWPSMYRIIKEFRPPWVVGENVAGLISMDGGRVFDGIVSDLENAGYTVEAFIIPACGLGAPHKRDRIWIVAHAALPNDRGNAGAVSGKDGRQKRNHLPESGSANQLFGEVATNPESAKCERSRLARARRDGFTDDNLTASNSNGKRCGECNPPAKPGFAGFGSGRNDSQWNEPWPSVATRICRMDDGIPRRVDRGKRLKALGNAIVPQVAFQIFQAIKSYPQ